MLKESKRLEVHGHRGARAVLPENSLPAFEYAIAEGVDVLELDMVVTRDDVVVVSHEPILISPLHVGPRDRVAVRELTLAELQAWDIGRSEGFPQQKGIAGTKIPTLDQVFQLAPQGAFRFNIETKITPDDPPGLTPPPEDFVRMVLEAIRAHGLESRVILQSFDFRTLRVMRRLAPEIELSALTEESKRSFVEICAEAGAGTVSPWSQLVTAKKVREAHEAGLRVIPWTPNTPAEWAAMIAAGVDGVITDDPAGLIAHLQR
ncbi:MAG: glycerophosphodiester phosphodiesterase family protein [Acidobacteriota bacterium]